MLCPALVCFAACVREAINPQSGLARVTGLAPTTGFPHILCPKRMQKNKHRKSNNCEFLFLLDHIETFPNIGGFFLANLANITSKILALTGVTFERLF